MNSLERIKAAIAFAPVDRTPAVPQLFGHAAVLAGVALGDYLRDGGLLARCQIGALQRYGHDIVFAFMDLCVETEAVGSVLQYRENQYPDVASYVLSPAGDVSALAVPDPAVVGRMPELLRAAGILRRELDDKVLVAGCVAGPMTLATQLLGIETALYLAADDPARFEKILDEIAAVRRGVAGRSGRGRFPAGLGICRPGRFPAFLRLRNSARGEAGKHRRHGGGMPGRVRRCRI